MCTYGECAALPTGDVKVDDIVSRNDVGDTITILGYLGTRLQNLTNTYCMIPYKFNGTGMPISCILALCMGESCNKC